MLRALRPRRELVIPALVVAAPLAYLVYREAGIQATRGVGIGGRLLGAVVVSLLAGYLAGVAITALVDVEGLTGDSAVVRLVFRPDDAALAILALLVALAAGYLGATLLVDLPGVVDLLATPVGVLLGLPLVVLWGGTVVVGNAVGREPAAWVQFGVVAAGIGLSVLWTAAIATGLSTVVDSR